MSALGEAVERNTSDTVTGAIDQDARRLDIIVGISELVDVVEGSQDALCVLH